MSELTVIDNVDAVEIFSKDGLTELLEKINSEAASIVPDVSTPRGRRAIASNAANVAKSKTYLDGLGKELVSGMKAKCKLIDNERKAMRDNLDALKAEVRKPLTEWEQAEKARTEKHEFNIREMEDAGEYSLNRWSELSVEAMQDRLKEIEAESIDSYEEYATDAAKAKDAAITQIKEAIAKREAYDKEQAELERLRAESEARAKADEEERLRKEGEERARIEAEKKAQAEAQKAEAEAQKADQEKRDAIKAKEDAELRAKQAEESAKREAEQAAQAERDRIEQERINEELAAKKREADKAHKKKINNAALDALVVAGVSKSAAKKAITAIAKGQVPHTRISY